MRTKTLFSFKKITICIALGTILFTFLSCKKGETLDDQSKPLRISCLDNTPTWSPDGTKIFFDTLRDGNWQIYVMNTDGSNLSNLSNNAFNDGVPSISPDGSRIVFQSTRAGNEEILVMNADGTDVKNLSKNPAEEALPSWSPDGSKIAFESDRDGNWEIYTMNPDGTDQTRLTISTAQDSRPFWSPDGTKIVYQSGKNRWNMEICVMNADGSNQTRLTENAGINRQPSWSPDGNRIIFISTRDGNHEIYTMNADGSNQTRLTNNQSNESWPTWSPDGQQIAFETDRDFDTEIYVMNADGSNPVNLTRNAPSNAAIGLAPLPQSELDLDEIPYKIIFESFRETDGKENWEICLINADGSGFVNLTNTPDIDEMYPHASPDGSRVCFSADEGEKPESKRRYVCYMNIDGTERVKIAENAYSPCWSGDGRSIAYLPSEFPRYSRNIGANKGLHIYNIETGDVTRASNDLIEHLGYICCSPDGKWILTAGRAFKVDENIRKRLLMEGCTVDISSDGKKLAWNTTDWSLNTGNLDLDSAQQNIKDHTVVVVCDREHWIYDSDWSPDGKYFVFTYAPEDASTSPGGRAPGADIGLCDLRTGKWTLVTTDGKHNKQPDWVPVQEEK
jgi:Tol biopolymer transport system component